MVNTKNVDKTTGNTNRNIEALNSPTPLYSATSEAVPSKKENKSSSNFSGILIVAPERTEFFVVHENGSRVGKDPEDGKIYEELPNSDYFIEPPIGNPQSTKTPTPYSGTQQLEMLDPIAGIYNLKLYSPTGVVKVTIATYDIEANSKVFEIDQSVEPNQGLEFDLIYSPEVGAKVDLKQKN